MRSRFYLFVNIFCFVHINKYIVSPDLDEYWWHVIMCVFEARVDVTDICISILNMPHGHMAVAVAVAVSVCFRFAHSIIMYRRLHSTRYNVIYRAGIDTRGSTMQLISTSCIRLWMRKWNTHTHTVCHERYIGAGAWTLDISAWVYDINNTDQSKKPHTSCFSWQFFWVFFRIWSSSSSMCCTLHISFAFKSLSCALEFKFLWLISCCVLMSWMRWDSRNTGHRNCWLIDENEIFRAQSTQANGFQLN